MSFCASQEAKLLVFFAKRPRRKSCARDKQQRRQFSDDRSILGANWGRNSHPQRRPNPRWQGLQNWNCISPRSARTLKASSLATAVCRYLLIFEACNIEQPPLYEPILTLNFWPRVPRSKFSNADRAMVFRPRNIILWERRKFISTPIPRTASWNKIDGGTSECDGTSSRPFWNEIELEWTMIDREGSAVLLYLILVD